MKFLLTIFICSGINANDCLTNQSYPKVYPDHHDCIRAGLTESYEILYANGNFTKEQINKLQLYAKYTCSPVKDEGKVTTSLIKLSIINLGPCTFVAFVDASHFYFYFSYVDGRLSS